MYKILTFNIPDLSNIFFIQSSEVGLIDNTNQRSYFRHPNGTLAETALAWSNTDGSLALGSISAVTAYNMHLDITYNTSAALKYVKQEINRYIKY